MILRTRFKNRNAAMVAGMFCLALANIISYLLRRMTHGYIDFIDLAQGVLIGMAIALMFVHFRMTRRGPHGTA